MNPHCRAANCIHCRRPLQQHEQQNQLPHRPVFSQHELQSHRRFGSRGTAAPRKHTRESGKAGVVRESWAGERREEPFFRPGRSERDLEGFVERYRRGQPRSGKFCPASPPFLVPPPRAWLLQNTTRTIMLVLVVALLGFGACDAFFAGSLAVSRSPLAECGGLQQVWCVGEVALLGTGPRAP